jgi:hypothetical protein
MNETPFAFDLRLNNQAKKMDYRCRLCGIEEHGGSIPNAGLYARMKAHLRELHSVRDADRLTPTYIERSSDSAEVLLGYSPAE